MALIDEAKTALRVSTNDSAITAEIQRYIDEAILDLTKTSNIAGFTSETADAFQKGAVLSYVSMKWNESRDQSLSDKLRTVYEDYKAKMSMSTAYGTFGG